ncbi:MAG: RNA polymerase sigma factor [Deltaproteobacteria bacterium]|nr:RNA polymerase sigma factor [Deltaproteobacteria bacterium]
MVTRQSDESLMLAYQAGDVRAFEVLVRRHRGPVFNFILRVIGDREQAEDLVQETFFRLARNAESYREKSKLTTWLYTIARNLSIDALRRGRHRKTTSLDAPLGGDGAEGASLAEHLPGQEAGTDRAASSARLGPVLKEAIEALPEEQREVFVLREYAGVPFKEIAEITDTPVNTVKSRMRYALEGLRRWLEDRGITAEDLFLDPHDPTEATGAAS